MLKDIHSFLLSCPVWQKAEFQEQSDYCHVSDREQELHLKCL